MLSVFMTYVVECTLTCVICVLCARVFSPFNYWKIRGVPQTKVKFPFIGDIYNVLLKPRHQPSVEQYNAYPGERYVGRYVLQKPIFLIRDPDLVECVLIKDFWHFHERAESVDPNSSLVSKHLLNLKGEHWKNMRNKLSPAFSSGKLKGMHSQLLQCADALGEFIKQFDDGRPFDVRNAVARFSMDVIGCCAFGLNTDTINDPESRFRQMGLGIFKATIKTKIMDVFRPMAKQVFKFLHIRNSHKRKHGDFFVNSISSMLEYRKKNNVVRHDFLHFINELKNKDEEIDTNYGISASDPFKFDDASLFSIAFTFFLAGFETTASTISNALFELAVHEEEQNQIYKEIKSVLLKHDNKITYDAVQEMGILDRVVCETLRLYPPGGTLMRKVTEEYKVPGSDVVLSEGTLVEIPIFALHHDPQYFPDPEEFRPERFNKEKFAIRKGTYLPFSDGPRTCVAARFATYESKVCLASIILRFKVLRCEKTEVPMSFDRHSFVVKAKGGVWLAIKPRV